MPAIIQSIQQVTITIPNSTATATGSLSPAVNTSNAAIWWNGQNTNYTGNAVQVCTVGVQLTNSTTLTATRSTATFANTVTVIVTVVEFISSVVNSIQYGTVPLSATTSGTYTLPTSVGANSFVILNGASGGNSVATSDPYVTLNQGTGVVTANMGASSTSTIYFCVVDLTSTVIASVQQIAVSINGFSTTSTTATITSVATANTILVSGGLIASNSSFFGFGSFTAQLTNATTVTFTRGGIGSAAIRPVVTVVQFQSNVLTANAVQRNTTTISSSSTTNTGTITSVNTAYALCNYCGFSGGTTTGNISPQQALATAVLTNATTETSTINTAAVANTTSWEVVEFLSTVTAQPQGLAILNP